MNISAEFSSTKENTKDPSEAIWKERCILMWKIVSPIWLIFGITGNSLALLVLRHARRRSASYRFFTALACSDLGTMCLGVFPRWLEKQFDFRLKQQGLVPCVMTTWVGFSCGSMSAHFLASVAVYRACAAARPHHLRRLCRNQLVDVAILALLIFNIVQYCYLPFALAFDGGECEFSPSFKKDVLPSLTYFDSFQYSVGPFTIILISNILIIRALIKTLSAVANITDRRASQIARRRRSTFTIVIAVSTAFLVLTFPFTFMRIIKHSKGTVLHLTKPQFSFVYEMTKLMWFLNSGIHFYLYILTSGDLRLIAKDYICRCALVLCPGFRTVGQCWTKQDKSVASVEPTGNVGSAGDAITTFPLSKLNE